jgi:H+-translocating NAD(P) transhydrogenase subunit beta
MSGSFINVAYLIASVLFIVGLKGLTHPKTAVRGNLLGASGMLLAVAVTLLDQSILSYEWIVVGVLLGSAVGVVLAVKIEMTAMPQLVALFNGLGGGASVLVAGAALTEAALAPPGAKGGLELQLSVATAASGLIGSVTLFGSVIAFAKLQELLSGNAILLKGRHLINAALLLCVLALAATLVANPGQTWAYWALAGAGAVLGVLVTIPIGGADMPVVIALLNSYSGLAAAATGFVLNNSVLIIAGSLVGASGIILTNIMCKAMNRSLANVLFATLGPAEDGLSGDEVYGGRVKATSADEVAMILETARKVVFVPGYGMAVAQAQHAVRDLARMLEERGTRVEFAIHPVAGRMPGHMNVLLAEADIAYEKLIEMDQANSEFQQSDVTIVIGANDVVNPVARTDPSSPIAGMPILDVDKSQTVVVIKRSLSPGFAGIPNPLFVADNTLMLFGDGKKAVVEISSAYKEAT